jgi:hypothetical protein
MAELNYKFTGVNTAQLANEVQILRQRSSTFRALEAAAAAAGCTTIEIRMGANLLPGDIADSTKTDSSTRTIRINSDATASWGVGGRQVTVGEVIAHELAHAVVPKDFREDGRLDYTESSKEGMWVRRQAGQVAIDLGLPGPNNADYLATRIPINETRGCTVQRPQGDGARDGVLFLDGSRGYNGIGSTVPPGSGSQDPINSRRLATDEPMQEFPPVNSTGALSMLGTPPKAAPPVNSGTFENRFGNWGSSPANIAPLIAPDRSQSFDPHFGSWGSVPADAPGDSGSPVLRALEKYRRSAAPDGPAPTSAQGIPAAIPASQAGVADAGRERGNFIWDSPITPAEAAAPSGPLSEAPSPDDYPRLRRVNSAFPGIARANPDQPEPEPTPLARIFSGKPMSSSPFALPFGSLPDNSDGSGVGNLVDLLVGLLPRRPAQLEPPQQTADSIPERRLGRSTYSISPASVFDTGASAVPLAQYSNANYSGGLLAAPAGSGPNQPAPPDDEQEQADLQALQAKLSSSGSINDAWALYKARLASRR